MVRRHSYRVAILLALLCPALLPAQQPAPTPDTAAADRVSNSYAIYSLLMPGEPFSQMSPDQAAHLAIADTTVNISDMNPAIAPDSQLQPPPGNPKGFAEAVQEFRARRYERVHLAPHLSIGRDYKMVTPAEVAEIRNTIGGISPGSDLKDKWAGYPGITFFSEVFFNAKQTAALVYMNNYCANLCANGQWIYLEKDGKQWVRRSGLNV